MTVLLIASVMDAAGVELGSHGLLFWADLPRRIPWRAECMIAGDTCPKACWVSQYDMALVMTMAISFDEISMLTKLNLEDV